MMGGVGRERSGPGESDAGASAPGVPAEGSMGRESSAVSTPLLRIESTDSDVGVQPKEVLAFIDSQNPGVLIVDTGPMRPRSVSTSRVGASGTSSAVHSRPISPVPSTRPATSATLTVGEGQHGVAGRPRSLSTGQSPTSPVERPGSSKANAVGASSQAET
jgi:hypothetical protein